MENLFYKIKRRIISLYQDYQYENIIFKQTEILQPVWEKKLAWLLLIAFIFFLFFNHYNMTNEVTLFLIFYLFLSFIIVYNSAARDFINFKNYYVARKQSFKNNFLFTQKRLIFTSFTFIKIAKPAVKACFACFISINGAIIGVYGTSKAIWPDYKSPTEILGTKITEYTGYPPESWDLKKSEINILKEQLNTKEEIINNKDEVIKELTKRLENNKK